MKITQKILQNIIKEEISKVLGEDEEGYDRTKYAHGRDTPADDPNIVQNQTFNRPTWKQLENDPGVGYIIQKLNAFFKESNFISKDEFEPLKKRVKELEEKANNNNVAPFQSGNIIRKENKKRRHQMKITQKTLKKIIREQIEKQLNEKTPEASAAMNQMYQQNLLNAPEVKVLKPKLDAIDGVDEVFVDGIKDSSKPGFKLIKVEFRVPAEG